MTEEQDWMDEEEKQEAQRFQQLLQVLRRRTKVVET
jgi:hypothetical protein